MSPRILIADRELCLAQALAEVLDEEYDSQVAQVVADGSVVTELSTGTAPDLVLVAASRPGPSAFELCAEVSATTAVLLLPRDGDVEAALIGALEAGGLGVVSPDVEPREFLRLVAAALRGEACVPRGMLGGVLRHLVARRRVDREVMERYGRLTGRERQVLLELARGRSVEDIAAAMVVSTSTVRTHAQHILEKLQVHSRVEAITLAVEHGLVDPQTGEIHP